MTGTATSSSTDLQIFGRNSFAVNAIDDVSVTATAVPEPGSLAVLGTGLALLGFLTRRRARWTRRVKWLSDRRTETGTVISLSKSPDISARRDHATVV